MKAQLLDISGKKIKEIDLPKVFSTKIREDILKKVFEVEKIMQPYGPNPESGKQHSASGIGRHLRHVWKSAYGHGRARTPRKVMWRRGSQFYWVGAEVSNTRGGRRAHPPTPIKNMQRKINKKEFEKALGSAIAATADAKIVASRYARLKEVKENLPLVVDSKVLSLKGKEFVKSLGEILGGLKVIGNREKKVRAGKGTRRNRKYKTSQGALLVVGNKEEIKTKIIENKKVKDLIVSDFYPIGRVVVYTQEALKSLENEFLSSPKRGQTNDLEKKK